MGKRPSSTLALICWTVLLIGAFAGVARLDHIVRIPKISRYDFFTPQGLPPQRAATDHGQTASPAPPAPPAPVAPAPVADDPAQRAQYDAETRKSIIELQPYRQSESAAISGARSGNAVLVNLNPTINAWYLLSIDWGGEDGRRFYHLENPDAAGQIVHLNEAGFSIMRPSGQTTPCDLTSGKPNALERAVTSGLPYAPLCDGKLYLRNRVAGHYTDLERMTDFLRENVWNGDEIVGFVKQSLYQDAFRETSTTTAPGSEQGPAIADGPAPAALRAADANSAVAAHDLGVDVIGPPSPLLGHWYPVRGLDGAFASAMVPQSVDEAIVKADKGSVNGLDGVEASALVHLVAFDLSQFDVKYALGTDNPRVGWSARAVLRSDRLPGPDGIDSTSPLVTNGIVNPSLLNRIAATFAGGFKREHGAFKWGELSRVRFSSHYGFIEQGVVFSKLQPGLATLYMLDDGSVHMETWIKDFDRLLPHVQFARQNGVPLVELDAKGNSIPGAFVNNWGAGNWSGSADAKLRTLRAGMCIVQSGTKQYLVHGVFTTATPSAMAVVFQSYGCRYAMLLDMNALEHSYIALYVRQGDKLLVEHPVSGMTEIDRTTSGKLVPRFVGYPDNRDFFYLVRRRSSP